VNRTVYLTSYVKYSKREMNNVPLEVRKLYHGSTRNDLHRVGLREGSYLAEDPNFAASFGPHIYEVAIPYEVKLIPGEDESHFITTQRISSKYITLKSKAWALRHANEYGEVDAWGDYE